MHEHGRYHTGVVSPFMSDGDKLAAVRAGLPALAAGIYLNTGSVGPLPSETARAMSDMDAYELATGRASIGYFHEFIDRMAEARAGVAAVLTTDVDAIALNHATTDGMNIAVWSVDWRPGDLAVTTQHEHPGGVGPLYALRDRAGIRLAFVAIANDDDDDAIVASFERAIQPDTRLVALSHVLWTTGRLMPVERIAEVAHAQGARVVIDGAQSAGAILLDVAVTGADLYAVPAQKWLLGPEGMGALWCSPTILDRASPAFAGYYSYSASDSSGGATLHPSARRLESSSWHRPSVVGFARSLGWLSMYVGLDFVYRRGAELAGRARAGLAAIPGVDVLTPTDRMAGLVSFRIRGWPCQDALDELGARVFAIARVVPLIDALRISVGFFNSEDEIDRFIDAVRLLADHAPGTLPRRSLTVLGDS